ncbi:ABC transporter substrate-binding protein [Herbaspirillum sp. RTI4]|uniref:ABC transporter substrate-binding protein n=1 Tax=Herbaspirillum sp. RTI4 TaxID=3048640 RepID=UPI002AB5B6B6|nr:ABC transporter substrate-binding protein [Herbaspirillum sp. RTI4]MDY7577212.1 ABC transporter substrate-binding protein [Herbaspirillum sp. RTI4]MEA9980502.1 ABC transporter substrate-binding protein [Herbaspirillum sp. RTI4]
MNRRKLITLGTAALIACQFGASALAEQGTFKVGSLNPITGAGSPYGSGMLKASQMAVAEVNAAGGAGGANFELLPEDSQTSPQAAVLAAKKLIEVQKVKAIIGTWSSGVSLAVIPITNDANVLLLHTSGAPALSVAPANAKKLGFRFQATNDRFGRAFAEIAKREKFKRPATMAFNNASGIGNTEGFRKSWTASGGTVVANVVYEPNRPSYRSELQEVLRGKPDVIVTGSYLADTTIILREWYQSGQPARWIIPGWAANSDLLKALGPDVTEGIISVESISAENSPSYKSFADRFAKQTKMAAQDNVYAAMTYDQVMVLALAVQAVGPTASADVLAKKVHEIGTPGGTIVNSFAEGKKLLAAGKRVTYNGASSALNFDEFNDVTPDFAASFVEKGKLVRKYVVKL